jgi:hypothetical protein
VIFNHEDAQAVLQLHLFEVQFDFSRLLRTRRRGEQAGEG